MDKSQAFSSASFNLDESHLCPDPTWKTAKIPAVESDRSISQFPLLSPASPMQRSALFLWVFFCYILIFRKHLFVFLCYLVEQQYGPLVFVWPCRMTFNKVWVSPGAPEVVSQEYNNVQSPLFYPDALHMPTENSVSS